MSSRDGVQGLYNRAEKSLRTPFASDNKTFYAHKESTCMAYINNDGLGRHESTGVDIPG
jgi:hypothetical protein